MNGLIEIQTAQKWLIDRDFGLRAIRLVNAMMNGHLLTNEKEKVLQDLYCMTESGFVNFASADHEDDGGHAENIKEPFISVLHLEGLLTREGGACTYGSRELRDLMMQAADQENCLGHLLIINGPGGVSNTIPDFMQAIDYARSKGQPIVGRIDGDCASAHIWVSAMCDEVYYNNPKDQIGSVGIYWAGITNKNGDTDPETGGTWHIVYDPESYDKNKPYRDIADNNDDTLIKEELISDGKVFRDYVKMRRPNATDEHLHGKMFDAAEVEGILVNGQATMREVFERIVALHTEYNKTNTSNPNNNKAMKEKFPALFAALQVEEMQMTEDGAFMNTELLARVNDILAEKQAQESPAEPAAEPADEPETPEVPETPETPAEPAAEPEAPAAEPEASVEAVANTEAEIGKMQEAIASAEALVAERDKTIAELQATVENLTQERNDISASLEKSGSDYAELLKALETAEATIAEQKAVIENLTKQVSALQTEVKELSEKPAPMVDSAAGVPADNGTGEAPKAKQCRVKRGMSYKEYRQAMAN